MKEFDVEITEILKKTVKVTAETKHDAEERAELEWDEGKHILSADDFVSSNFTAVAEREKLLDILLVEPMKPPKPVQIPDTLKALQQAVGGYIETLSVYDDAILVCNEEGKINGSQLNRGIYNEDGELVEIIGGTFLVVGMGEEKFESLSSELMDKYKEQFEKPEKFFKIAGKIIAQKVEPPKDKEVMKKSDQER